MGSCGAGVLAYDQASAVDASDHALCLLRVAGTGTRVWREERHAHGTASGWTTTGNEKRARERLVTRPDSASPGVHTPPTCDEAASHAPMIGGDTMKHLQIVCVLAGMTTALALAPIATADTCCANTRVVFTPTSADPGDVIAIDGIRCLAYDNSGPLELNLEAFWLSSDRVPADPDPGSAPGGPARPANDLPPVDQWLPFASVTHAGQARSGTTTIVVPDLPDGSYQLWWRCDNGGGPGSGIHYSGGSRLFVGIPDPDTATVDPEPTTSPVGPALLRPGRSRRWTHHVRPPFKGSPVPAVDLSLASDRVAPRARARGRAAPSAGKHADVGSYRARHRSQG